MKSTNRAAQTLVLLGFVIALFSCSNPSANVETLVKEETADSLPEKTSAVPNENSDIKVAFIYGDTINEKYQFLLDAEAELEAERKRIERRIRTKFETAEKRAAELQQKAPTMTQFEMQEAQLEMQEMDLDIQQFQDKLAADFRKREAELQQQYLDKVNTYLEEYNADGTYDMIFNFQHGGNLLWIKNHYDVTSDILEGLNKAYEKELSEKRAE